MSSRIGERIATALKTDSTTGAGATPTITQAEAKGIIDAAKAEKKWTPELKAEVDALLSSGSTKFEGTAKADLQQFLAATPVQKDLADPAVLTKHTTEISWNPVQDGKLFVDGVNFDDVAQGYIGDCYLEGAMSAVAKANPKAIEDAVKDNGNGTYDVRFFESAGYGQPMKPVTVTVDGDLPSRSAGSQPYYAHARERTELWPGLIEKAYAQWKGGYEAIGNGGSPGGMMTSLTGKQSTYSSNSTATADQLFDHIKRNASSSMPMTATTYGEDKEALYTNTGVHANHAYTVLGTSEENGTKYVQLRNPWGFSEGGNDGKDDGIFKLPLTDFVKLYQGTDFGG
jgi:hypothetical protein